MQHTLFYLGNEGSQNTKMSWNDVRNLSVSGFRDFAGQTSADQVGAIRIRLAAAA